MLLAQGNYLIHVLYDNNVGHCVIRNALLSPKSTLLSFVSTQMSCYQLNPSFYLLQRLLNILLSSVEGLPNSNYNKNQISKSTLYTQRKENK